MEIEKQVCWLPKDSLDAMGTTFVVQEFNECEVVKDGKKLKDYQIVIQRGDNAMYKLSVWGNSLNRLIDKWGNDTTKWILRKVLLKEVHTEEGKRIVEFNPL